MKQSLAPIITSREVMPGTYLIWLESLETAPEAKPGQFVLLRCGEETLLRRPLSIHQRDGDKLALLFTVVGRGTDWLSRRKVGSILDLLGPLGNGFTLPEKAQHILLVAGGIGIAPLRYLADEAIRQGNLITLLLGARTKSQLYPERLLPSEIKLVTATDDGTTDNKGQVNELLPKYADWADQVFACGPATMYRDMAAKYHDALKNRSVQVSLEMRMGCGRGVCYGCTVKTKSGLKQVCRDGPVFELGDILWDEIGPI